MTNSEILRQVDLLYRRSGNLLARTKKTKEECKAEYRLYEKAVRNEEALKNKGNSSKKTFLSGTVYLGVFFLMHEKLGSSLKKNPNSNCLKQLLSLAECIALAESILDQSAAKSKYASIRVKNDPRAEQRKFVYECWCAWQKTPERYKNKTHFANDMLDKFRSDDPNENAKSLNNPKSITDWCRLWEKQKV